MSIDNNAPGGGNIPDERIPTIPNEPAAPPENMDVAPPNEGTTPPASQHGPFKTAEEKADYEKGVAERILSNLAEKNLLRMPGEKPEKPKAESREDPMKAHLAEFEKEVRKDIKEGTTVEDAIMKGLASTYKRVLETSLAISEKMTKAELAKTVGQVFERFHKEDSGRFFKNNPEFAELEDDVRDLVDNYQGKGNPIDALIKLKRNFKKTAEPKPEQEYTDTEKALLEARGGKNYMESVAPHDGPANGGGSYVKTRAQMIENIVAAAANNDTATYEKLIRTWKPGGR